MVAEVLSSRCVSSRVVAGLSSALSGVRYAVTVTVVTGGAIGAAAPVTGVPAVDLDCAVPFALAVCADCPHRSCAPSSATAANSAPNVALKGNHCIRMGAGTGDQALK